MPIIEPPKAKREGRKFKFETVRNELGIQTDQANERDNKRRIISKEGKIVVQRGKDIIEIIEPTEPVSEANDSKLEEN